MYDISSNNSVTKDDVSRSIDKGETMAALLLLIIFGLGVAAFATQNTGSVHLLLGSYVFSNIPLYVVVVGSILLGVFISWFVTIIDTFSTLFTLHGKDEALRKLEKEMEKLKEKNHELEMELAKQGRESTQHAENPQDILDHPSLFHQVKQSFGLTSG